MQVEYCWSAMNEASQDKGLEMESAVKTEVHMDHTYNVRTIFSSLEVTPWAPSTTLRLKTG
jgi:hypothetical protein